MGRTVKYGVDDARCSPHGSLAHSCVDCAHYFDRASRWPPCVRPRCPHTVAVALGVENPQSTGCVLHQTARSSYLTYASPGRVDEGPKQRSVHVPREARVTRAGFHASSQERRKAPTSCLHCCGADESSEMLIVTPVWHEEPRPKRQAHLETAACRCWSIWPSVSFAACLQAQHSQVSGGIIVTRSMQKSASQLTTRLTSPPREGARALVDGGT